MRKYAFVIVAIVLILGAVLAVVDRRPSATTAADLGLNSDSQVDYRLAVIAEDGRYFPESLELHAGKTYELLVVALNGTQKLNIPGLGVDVTLQPDRINQVSLDTPAVGTYRYTSRSGGSLSVYVTEGDASRRASNAVEVAVIGTELGFLPTKLEVPQGRRIVIGATGLGDSRDLKIDGTHVAFSVWPKKISTYSTVFTEAGQYALACGNCTGEAAAPGSFLVQPQPKTAVEESPDNPTGAFVGQRAPDFSVQTVDGKTVNLQDLRGKLVFLNFWATWCPPCREEMPAIQQLYDKGIPDLYILGMNLHELNAVVQNFIASSNYTFPIGLDPTGKVANEYLIRAVPTSYFIDREGIIRGKYTGAMSLGLMEDYLDKARGLSQQ